MSDQPIEPVKPARKLVGQILSDSDHKLYFRNLLSEPSFSAVAASLADDPVLVVRVVDYQSAIAAALESGYETALKEQRRKERERGK